ncbi:hypothetical protein AZO1586R_350 [Bathymodiolus azoricus thioautotrophic gill symbiont]|uniref:Uncharacterized protein n=1 Tax=Bathymodiolus azoricus thioautotrophic gill symbiont TaxID=235205 RepID=A0ACA8ZN44_9GAMM|nr:hypothetical protein [Bathymodiolus azoricus thioautotrophic gill symbiont]CAB5495997.1 hypothetical protein AZO1586R_350 [Bathymodiolus azoricus thioautotrophic gill symbiont]CAC9515103.1 hypothetical protein [uncultured Gammaproteobacteria bacterium]
MCKPLFPLKAISYKDNGEIEEVEFLENLEAISCNVEVYSDEENEKNKDYSLKIFDSKNREVYLIVDERLEVKVLKLKNRPCKLDCVNPYTLYP